MMYWVRTVSDSMVSRSGVIFTTLRSSSRTTRFTQQICKEDLIKYSFLVIIYTCLSKG